MKRFLSAVLSVLAIVSCGTASKSPASHVGNDFENEGVNVGYGAQSRRDNNFAVGSVKVDDGVISSYETITDYLKARVAGIEVLDNGGVRVRGENSMNLSTEALLVVDGVEVDNLKYLSPSEVHSVNVLKDASASAYGSKGANGVVLITTKASYEQKQAEAAALKAKRDAARQARKEKKNQ